MQSTVMTVTSKSPSTESPAKQLAGFLAKFEPEVAALARSCRAAMRKRLPTANELVYDNYNALAIGYGSTERASDAIVSLPVTPRGVALCFIYGAKLPDPKKILQGGGFFASQLQDGQLLDRRLL